MSVIEAFKDYLVGILPVTFGQDLFIGEAPSSNKVPDTIWWIVARGGDKTTDYPTGGAVKSYQIDIFHRDRDYKSLSDELSSLEELLNCEECTQLTGFQTMDSQASVLGIDNDLDGEDRKIGLLQATITVYKPC